MYDIRKMQEQALVDAIEKRADAETARGVVCGKDGTEPDAEWVDAAMERLENSFDEDTVKRIRMDCQCGYGMEEKIALVKELMAGASSMETFAGSEKAHAAGLYCEDGELYLQFAFCPVTARRSLKALLAAPWTLNC